MTKSLLSSTCVAILLVALSWTPASAQAPGAAAYPAPQVATLDLSYLFRNHVRYKQQDEVLKGEITQAEQTFAAEQKAMQEMGRRAAEYKPGSPEYKQIEEELAKRDADLRLRGAILQKNFGEKKAKIYFDILQETKTCVQYYAEQHGILLVINFNGDEVDGGNPQSVMRGLNETVIYQHRTVDITPVILEICNKNAVTAGAPGATVPR